MARKRAKRDTESLKNNEKNNESGRGKSRNLEKDTWKPGQSGNPLGRPRGSVSLTTQLKRVMGQIVEGDRQGIL